MPTTTTQLSLVTAAFAANLENNLLAARLMRFRPNKNRTTDPLNRYQYIERTPPRYNLRRTTGGNADITAARQTSDFGAEIYQLNSTWTIDTDYTDFSGIRDEDTALRDERLRMIGQRAGEDIDADLLRATVLCGCNWTGTPANDVSSVEALMAGYVRMKEEGVPDGEMYAVLAYRDYPALAGTLLRSYQANSQTQESIIGQIGPESRLKELIGMKVMFTQQLPALTTGTRTNGTVAGANQGVNYSAVSRSTTTNGQYLTQLLNLSGLGANATISDGEVFEIAGVEAWDNRKNATQGRPQNFRVIGDTVATAGGTATVRIFPAIIAPVGPTLTGDLGLNRAHATVSAVPANLAAVVFRGAASTTFLQRAIVGRPAIRVECAEMEDGSSGENSRIRLRDVPLSVHGYKFTDGNIRQTTLRFDGVYQPNIEAYGRYYSCRISG